MSDNFLTKNRKLYEYHHLDSTEPEVKADDFKYDKIVKTTYSKSLGVCGDIMEFYRDIFNPDFYVKKLFYIMFCVFFVEFLSVRACVSFILYRICLLQSFRFVLYSVFLF